MEIRSRNSRPQSPFLPQQNLNFESNQSKPITSMFSQQLTAKDILMQLADCDNASPLKIHKPNIDGWMHPTVTSAKISQQTPSKGLKYFRRTMHMRPYPSSKNHNTSYQQQQNLQESIIPHLKQILKKLQSPEKRRVVEKKKKMEYLQEKINRKRQPLLMGQLFQNKRHSIRIKNNSSQKKTIKNITFANFNDVKENRARIVFSRQRGDTEQKDFSEQLYNIREARKNRTLRNLLF